MVRFFRIIQIFGLVQLGIACTTSKLIYWSDYPSYSEHIRSTEPGTPYNSVKNHPRRVLMIYAGSSAHHLDFEGRAKNSQLIEQLEAERYSVSLRYANTPEKLKRVLNSFPKESIDVIVLHNEAIRFGRLRRASVLQKYLARMASSKDFDLMKDDRIIKVSPCIKKHGSKKSLFDPATPQCFFEKLSCLSKAKVIAPVYHVTQTKIEADADQNFKFVDSFVSLPIPTKTLSCGRLAQKRSSQVQASKRTLTQINLLKNLEKASTAARVRGILSKHRLLVKESGPDFIEAALIKSVMLQDRAAVGELLKSSSLANVRDHRGRAAIHIAAQNGSLDIVKLLNRYGANLNSQDRSGNTPLHFAAMYGHTDVVKFLVAQGADADTLNKQGYYPLYLATKRGHDDIIYALIHSKPRIDRLDRYGLTPLSKALLHGKDYWVVLTLVKKLIASGANVNAPNRDGSTPVFHALEWNGLLLKTLLDSGAHVTRQNRLGENPIHFVVPDDRKKSYYMEHQIKNVRRLSDAGAQVDKLDHLGESPLHKALILDRSPEQLDLIKALIESGSNVNQLDSFEEHPLYTAAEMNNIEALKILIKAGARPSRRLVRSIQKVFSQDNTHWSRNIVDQEKIMSHLKKASAQQNKKKRK